MAKGQYDRDHIGVIRRIRLLTGLAALLLVTFAFVLGVALPADGGMAPDWNKNSPVLILRLDRKPGSQTLPCLELGNDGRHIREAELCRPAEK